MEIGMRFEQAKRAISLKELIEQYLKDNNIGKAYAPKILDMLALVDLTGLEENALLEKVEMAVNLLN